MAYIPPMRDYKPFYIQAETDETATDTREWGLIAKTNPYPALPDPKDPYGNDWNDEDGEEEFTAAMHYKSLEFEVAFYCKAFAAEGDSAVKVLRDQLDAFFDKIKQGDFRIYDSYTGLGRQKVRYAGFKEDGFLQRKDWARSIFTVTFKANDPITRMTLEEGSIVEE